MADEELVGVVLWQATVELTAPWETQYPANHTAEAMRGECRARGLSAAGTKGDMARRLAATGYDPLGVASRELRITAGADQATLAAACDALGIPADGDSVVLAKRIVARVDGAAPPV
jgi:hypothetical protein